MARPKGADTNVADRLSQAAGRGFRVGGYGGVGVDGLAREAGLTSGAFYAHFKSKAEAFRHVVGVGLRDLRDGIRELREARGAGWRAAFVDFYLGERRTGPLGESCALQSLTGEVMRSDSETRRLYAVELRGVLDAMAADEPARARADAIALLALLSGGVSMARALEDPALAEEVAASVRAAALAMTPRD